MAIYLVTYDLSAPGRNYDALYEHLRSYGTYSHPVESVWLVKSSRTAAEVRDATKKHLDGNDKLLVVEAGSSAAWRNLRDATSDWLRKQL